MIGRWTNASLRLTMSGLHRLLRAFWFVRRPYTRGAHAIAVSQRGTLILVKLRYAPGWRLPGGGVKAGEGPREAVLRELQEEIGMASHGEVQLVRELQEDVDFKMDTASLFIVRDVEYSPNWSIEVEAVREVPINRLPANVSPRTAAWLRAVRGVL